MLWRFLTKAVPTLDRLQGIVPLSNTNCYLCHTHEESIHHIALECQVSKLIWWNSPWQLRLEAFHQLTFLAWVELIHGDKNHIPLPTTEKRKLIQFFVVSLELIWMTRNKIWKTNEAADWQELSNLINQSYIKYWKASLSRLEKKKLWHDGLVNAQWMPPMEGGMKMNFDAAFKEGRTVTGYVLHDHRGTILGAWVTGLVSDNPFCAETEAAIQALKRAQELHLEKIHFEGDAANVILALQGVVRFEDWRAKAKLDEGHRLLSQHLYWSVGFTPRKCNSTGHWLAKWATSLSFCGSVPTDSLDPSLWGERRGG